MVRVVGLGLAAERPDLRSGCPAIRKHRGLACGDAVMSWCPSGFIPFAAILRFLDENWTAWHISGRLLANVVAWPPEDERANFGDYLPNLMGPDLSAGTLRAAGVRSQDGKLFWLPAETWRISHYSDMEIRFISPIEAALAGYELSVPMNDGTFGNTLPILPKAALRTWCRVETERPIFDEPPIEPEDLEPREKRPILTLRPTNSVQTWLDGYARGSKAAGKLVKRDDAITTAMRVLSCTYRDAERAFEALPYPELRNPPRKAPT